MEELDVLDVRILQSVTEGRYHSRNEVHCWVVDELPSVALLQRRLDRLEEEGLVRFEPGMGYIRTAEGTLRVSCLEDGNNVLEGAGI